MNDPVIRRAASDAEWNDAVGMVWRYFTLLGVDPAAQGVPADGAALRRRYEAAHGAMFLAYHGEDCVASAGLQRIDSTIAEQKRLFVDSGQRGKGLGRRLTEACIDAARQLGCTLLRCRVLAVQEAARQLYLGLGFADRGSDEAGRVHIFERALD